MSSPDAKRRKAISQMQKKEIRDYYHRDPNIKPSHKDVQLWFREKTQHTLADSIISRILSPSYAYLDQPGAAHGTKKKNREPKWRVLENALHEWQLRMKSQNMPVTGDTLKDMAAVLWGYLPEYAGQPKPKFSTGWLDGFKHRYRIGKRKKRGETMDADRDITVLENDQMDNITSSHQIGDEEAEHEVDTEYAVEKERKRSTQEALYALSELQIYEEQQPPNDNSAYIKHFLNMYEETVRKRKAAGSD